MRDPQNERPRNSIGGFAFLVFRLRFRRFWLGCLRHAAIPRMGRVEISYLFQTLSTHTVAQTTQRAERTTQSATRDTERSRPGKGKICFCYRLRLWFCFGKVYNSPDVLRIKEASIKSLQNKRQAMTLCHTHAHL